MNGTSSSLQFCKIHDLRLDGVTKTTGRHGIIDQSTGPTVFHENLYLRNFDDAFTIYNSNNRHVRAIRIVTANTGIRLLKGGTLTPPNATFIDNFYISDCATNPINIVSDVAGETATVVKISKGVVESNTGPIVITGYPTATELDSIYVEGNGRGQDIYIKGVSSSFAPTNIILRNIRGRGNVTTQANMIKIDDCDKILIENCLAVNYTSSMILLNKNAEYELNVVNPGLAEGTPNLITQTTSLTTTLARLAGSVSLNRVTGHIALLPASTSIGDVVILGSAGRYVSTARADSNLPGVVLYPAAAGDTPGVIANNGLALVNVNAAVAAGDTLSTSTTAGQAKVNNTQTDPRKIIGFAMEATGAAGLAWAKIL